MSRYEISENGNFLILPVAKLPLMCVRPTYNASPDDEFPDETAFLGTCPLAETTQSKPVPHRTYI